MGKSSKKARSDRINALRKQYDTFLEEDRRRKNRNEYILGWLDRVRSTSSLSTARIQPTSFETQKPNFAPQLDYVPKQSPLASHQLNIKHPSIVNLDDSKILQEVSKKYILIPKKTRVYDTEPDNTQYVQNVPSEINSDKDWKSKYNILNVLKNNEKNESSEKKDIDKLIKGVEVPKVEAESYQRNKLYDETINKTQNNYEQSIFKNEDEDIVPDSMSGKTKEVNNLNTSHHDLDTEPVQEGIEYQSNIKKLEFTKAPEVNGPLKLKEIKNNGNNLPNNILIEKHPDVDSTMVPQAFIAPTENIIKLEEHQYTNLETQNDNSHEPISTLPIDSEEPIVQSYENNDYQEDQIIHKENPIDSANKFNEPEETESRSSIQKDSVICEDNSMYVPESNESHEDQINEFETEQRELFYSEEPDVNYAYDEKVDNNVTYENNEYSYYEATKEDPNQYTAGINEHEEATERYDPNYEQQYVNSYEGNVLQNEYPNEQFIQDPSEYQQQQYYDNYEQPLQGTTLTDNQEYENTEYNVTANASQEAYVDDSYKQNFNTDENLQNVTLEQITEQQLNIEDGYTENQPLSEVNQEVAQSTNLETTIIAP
ncbi:unnamed protein product [Leptosia nina]|uniref:Uncharacterized protein n=1 Tax=Leptosia nina TaxID=320188 RepID=A0AAV1JMW2_9NEOP